MSNKMPKHLIRNYEEGDAFVLPIKNGGYVIGIAARVALNGGYVLTYFFGPRRQTPPMLSELVGFSPSAALTVARCSDLGLVTGEWQVIGHLPNWNREDWPIPKFIRRHPTNEWAYLVEYVHDRKLKEHSAVRCDPNITGYPEDGAWGYVYAQNKLDLLLPPT